MSETTLDILFGASGAVLSAALIGCFALVRQYIAKRWKSKDDQILEYLRGNDRRIIEALQAQESQEKEAFEAILKSQIGQTKILRRVILALKGEKNGNVDAALDELNQMESDLQDYLIGRNQVSRFNSASWESGL